MDLRSPTFSLRKFSESVSDLDVMQIMDAILDELHTIKMKCRSLGFGNMPKKRSRARQYYDDLSALVPLYTTTSLPEFREGFVKEAWPLLQILSQRLVCLSTLREWPEA